MALGGLGGSWEGKWTGKEGEKGASQRVIRERKGICFRGIDIERL